MSQSRLTLALLTLLVLHLALTGTAAVDEDENDSAATLRRARSNLRSVSARGSNAVSGGSRRKGGKMAAAASPQVDPKTFENYDKVMDELEENPRFKAAGKRLDGNKAGGAASGGRVKPVKTKSKKTKAARSSASGGSRRKGGQMNAAANPQVDPKQYENYDKVLDELEENPTFKAAGKRLNGKKK